MEKCMDVIKTRTAAHGTTLDHAARNGEYAKALDAYIRTKELEELLEELEGRPENGNTTD
ncbi:hypothetical protein [Eubacterium aggregans]|uniref:hypothetical protein n=1 Tax=Eubacterium aggregans TaxID=81409 RepID=UPI003F3DC9F8